MADALHNHLLTKHLTQFSAKLDELIAEVRRYDSQRLPPELIDELASTTGELMLVLMEHQTTHQSNELTRRAVSDARQLRARARSLDPHSETLAETAMSLTKDVEQIVRQDKRAA